ncbi:MAG: hypothetical protein ACR2P5_09900 [Gammaproteobacteria bacterium]
MFKLLDLNEAAVISGSLAKIFGKKLIDSKTIKNRVSGKHEPQWTLLENLNRFKIQEPGKIEQAKKIMAMTGEVYGPDAVRVNRTIVALYVLAKNLQRPGENYSANVIHDIVKREKQLEQFIGARDWMSVRDNLSGDMLAGKILRASEMELLRKSNDDNSFGVSLAPLRLKMPLYVAAAFEVECFAGCDREVSCQIAGGKKGAVGVFFEILVKNLKCKKIEFVRDYMINKTSKEEDSNVRKLRRWIKGKSVPSHGVVLDIIRAISKNDNVDDYICGRIMFLFSIAVYSVNMEKEIESKLSLNINWENEYRRFLEMHAARIEKQSRSD